MCEVRKHFLPRVAVEILLRVNELSEQLRGKYTNFEVTEYDWVLSHVLCADLSERRDMQAFEKRTRIGIIISRDGEKKPGQNF